MVNNKKAINFESVVYLYICFQMTVTEKNVNNINFQIVKIFGLLVFLLIFAIFNSCAVIEAPSGGPKDTIPPEIRYSSIQRGTLNFEEKSITLRFSKYMDKGKVLENLSISPKTELKFDWSGKELEILFQKQLDTNTTYSLQLGTEYTDYYNVKPAEAFELIFSTGNKLDSGIISGKLIDERSAGAFIFVYNITNINADTLNFRHTLPNYRVQIGTSGEFRLGAIKDGKYRVFAIRDEFKNELYDDNDAFGAPESDIVVKDAKSASLVLRIGPPVDKTPPELMSAEANYANIIVARFSESLDSNFVRSESFYLIDSANSNPIKINGVSFAGNNRDVTIYTDEMLDSAKLYILTAFKLSEFSIRDTSGNLIDSINMAKFNGYSRIDSTQPKINAYPFGDSVSNIAQNKYIRFIFSNPIDTASFRNSLTMKKLDSKNSIEYRILPFLNNVVRLEPIEIFEPETWYELILKSKTLKGLNGIYAQDTTIRLRFRTSDLRSLGNASGTVRGVDFCKDKLIITIFNKDKNKRYISKTDKDGKWNFSNIEPGEYSIEAFCDSNTDGLYSFGTAIPFSFSEPFFIVESKLNIRSRWNVEDFIINISEPEK